MKSIKFTKNDKEFLMIQDWWKLFQECYEIDQADEWENVIQKVCDLSEKYENCELVKDLGNVLINELERKYKNGKN